MHLAEFVCTVRRIIALDFNAFLLVRQQAARNYFSEIHCMFIVFKQASVLKNDCRRAGLPIDCYILTGINELQYEVLVSCCFTW